MALLHHLIYNSVFTSAYGLPKTKGSIAQYHLSPPDLSIIVVDMAILGPYQITALVVIGTSAAYFFTQLYHARMLLYERQKLGLVSHFESSEDSLELRMSSLWLPVTIFSLAICCTSSP